VCHSDNPLRRARLQRRMDLDQIAARTLLSPRIVRLIDDGRFTELPGGVYARAHVRTFAGAVGLDPEAVVCELEDRLPAAADPFPAMWVIARAADPPWLVDLRDAATRVRAWAVARATSRRSDTARRGLAGLADAVLLLVLLGTLIQLTSWTIGVHPQALLKPDQWPLAVMWGILTLLYFLVLGVVAGRTPGEAVTRMGAPELGMPLQWRRFSVSLGTESTLIPTIQRLRCEVGNWRVLVKAHGTRENGAHSH
jgi:Helix-turn-helix domain